ncbi:hypothetical protein [Photobacterium rosenbergii]|nr:hypothetical protein [Photobacterium rosenbergii]
MKVKAQAHLAKVRKKYLEAYQTNKKNRMRLKGLAGGNWPERK